MKYALKSAAAMAAFSFTLAGCASAPEPSPRLLAAEASLRMAKSDADTMESGRAPLEKAEVALRDARDFYMDRKTDNYEHSIRMGESYTQLAEARGGQLEANRKIASLNTARADIVSEARKLEVARAERATATAQAATTAARAATAGAEARASQSATVAAAAVADSAVARADQAAAEARTDALRAELAGYEQQKTALGVTLIMRDLQFTSGSAVLGAGAQGRLAPLAAFLAKQPEAKIQIAGHTDSQGADAANMDLSARRAQSVAAFLASTGVSVSRMNAIGMGETVPTSTNDTAAGRAINRRVEVTILN
jgi:outer membrane protein OmpA-like peptidoglycan-associated protein